MTNVEIRRKFQVPKLRSTRRTRLRQKHYGAAGKRQAPGKFQAPKFQVPKLRSTRRTRTRTRRRHPPPTGGETSVTSVTTRMNIGFLTFASVTNWDQALQTEDQALQTDPQALQPLEAPRPTANHQRDSKRQFPRFGDPRQKDLSLGVSRFQ